MGTEIGLGLEITELRLGLPGRGGGGTWMEKNEKKRAFSEIDDNDNDHQRRRACNKSRATEQAAVVGWPPVCSYRKKINQISTTKAYVKVSMDGAPFLRKIDMSNYKEYSDFVEALEKLFGCFGALGEQGLKKEGDSSEYTAIYEDKDGDWMLVGDVPWEMFIETCKRLRIKKSSDGNGTGVLNACNKV